MILETAFSGSAELYCITPELIFNGLLFKQVAFSMLPFQCCDFTCNVLSGHGVAREHLLISFHLHTHKAGRKSTATAR